MAARLFAERDVKFSGTHVLVSVIRIVFFFFFEFSLFHPLISYGMCAVFFDILLYFCDNQSYECQCFLGLTY